MSTGHAVYGLRAELPCLRVLVFIYKYVTKSYKIWFRKYTCTIAATCNDFSRLHRCFIWRCGRVSPLRGARLNQLTALIVNTGGHVCENQVTKLNNHAAICIDSDWRRSPSSERRLMDARHLARLGARCRPVPTAARIFFQLLYISIGSDSAVSAGSGRARRSLQFAPAHTPCLITFSLAAWPMIKRGNMKESNSLSR
jgi:hypothetical protein